MFCYSCDLCALVCVAVFKCVLLCVGVLVCFGVCLLCYVMLCYIPSLLGDVFILKVNLELVGVTSRDDRLAMFLLTPGGNRSTIPEGLM